MDTERSPRAILSELAGHPQGEVLAKLVHTLAVTAYDERRTSLDEGLDEAAARLGVEEGLAGTAYGNVLRALRKGATANAPERALLGALIAKGVALSPPQGREAEERVAQTLAWVGAHTPAEPVAALEALGDKAHPLYEALGALLRRHDEGTPAIDRPSAIVALSALARSSDPVAQAVRASLTLRDPLLASLAAPPSSTPAAAGVPTPTDAGKLAFQCEEISPPRPSWLTVLLTLTWILPAVVAARAFGRFALRLRRPAEIAIAKEGITVRSRIELLGKVVSEKETFLPLDGLTRVAREVRYPRLATYAGVVCLLLGSYLGLRLVLDGFRSGSPEFLGLGVAILVIGLAIDYALTLLPSPASRCQLLVESKKGRVALAGMDRQAADAALLRLRP